MTIWFELHALTILMLIAIVILVAAHARYRLMQREIERLHIQKWELEDELRDCADGDETW